MDSEDSISNIEEEYKKIVDAVGSSEEYKIKCINDIFNKIESDKADEFIKKIGMIYGTLGKVPDDDKLPDKIKKKLYEGFKIGVEKEPEEIKKMINIFDMFSIKNRKNQSNPNRQVNKPRRSRKSKKSKRNN